MIEVQRFQIRKEDILSLGKEETAFLLLAGHAANQLNVLIKIVNLSSNYSSEAEIANKLSAAQTHILIRLLYGTLGETLEWMKRPDTQKLIGMKYHEKLPTESKSAYARLKALWGRPNILHYLRNNFAFHFPKPDQILAGLASVPDEEDWSWYAAPEDTNSLYLISELAVGYGSLSAASELQENEAFSKIMSNVIAVSNDFSAVLGSLIAVIAGQNLLEKFERSIVRFHGAPDAKTTSLSFFHEEVPLPPVPTHSHDAY